MHYLTVSILFIIVMSKSFENSSVFLLIILLTWFSLFKIIGIEVFTESNIYYEKNLELIYSLANIAINSTFLLYVIYIIVSIDLLKKKTILKYQNTKRGLFFLENIIFYSTYNYNVYYILKKNNNFALHENIISLIHPLITISTIILLLSIITKKNNKEKILKVYYMITLSLFLGSIWATSTEGWGGMWVWDPTEITLLLLSFFVLLLIHSRFFLSKKKLMLYWIIPVFFFYYQITKLNLVSGIHNFYVNEISKFTQYSLFIFMLSIINMLIILKLHRIIKMQSINQYMVVLTFLATIIFFIKNNNLHTNNYIIDLITYNYFIYIFVINMLIYFVYQQKNILWYTLYINSILFLLILIDLKNTIIIIFFIVKLIDIKTNSIHKWALYNHTIHWITLLILICSYIQFKTYNFENTDIFLENVFFKTHFSKYTFQEINLTNNLLSKQVINDTTYFIINKSNNLFMIENTQSYFNNYSTSLIDLLTISIEKKNLLNFSKSEVNLYIQKFIFISFWFFLIIYLKIKW